MNTASETSILSIDSDWAQRNSARASIRVLVKYILSTFGYLRDLPDAALRTVLQQADVLSESWMA